MLFTMHREGTPQSTLQVLSALVYFGKKSLNPRRKIECTCARMIRKSPDVQFGNRFSTWNEGSMSGKWGEISDTLKNIVFIFAVCRR